MDQRGIFRFSTDAVPVRDRLAVLREEFGRNHRSLRGAGHCALRNIF
jgi:hypothetical protein